MIYAVNMLLILIYAIFLHPDSSSERNRKIFCTLVIIQLTCISGFQYDVGTDYRSYLHMYESIRRMTWKGMTNYFYWKEPIYCIYTKIMAIIFKENFIPYFFGMSLINVFFVMKAIYDRKEGIFWSTYIYISMGLFYISMNQMRQMIAASIILYSVKYIENKNWKKYLFWILVAAGIHNTSLIMLPCYFLRDLKLRSRKKAISILIFICISIYFFSPLIIDNFLSLTSYGWMLSKYAEGSQSNMIINLLYRGTLLVGCIFYIKPVLNKDKKYEVLYWLSIMGIVFQIISVYSPSVSRVSTYFYAVFIFLIPKVLEEIPNRIEKVFAKFIIFIGMLSYHIFYLVYRLDSLEYHSIFSI